MTTLTILGPGTQNHTGDSLTGVTEIKFNAPAGTSTTAIFNTSQFGAVFPAITGGLGSDNLQLIMTTTSFSAFAMTFNNFSAGDVLTIVGTGGADTIGGARDVSDVLFGGSGADSLTGGNADDIFAYGIGGAEIAAGESLNGGLGADAVVVSTNGGVFDFSAATLSSVEILGFSDLPAFTHTATVVLGGNQVGPGGLTSFLGNASVAVSLTVSGSAVDLSHVSITAWNGQITINGTVGADNLTGSDQIDIINGNAGNDILKGGLGGDTLDGGNDTDTASYAGNSTGVRVSLALQGAAQDTVGAGLDTLNNIENLTGSSFADTLTGNGGVNVMNGGAGNDVLVGGAGIDTLVGGAGRDIMTGGTEHDVFDFNSVKESGKTASTRDKITDFTHGLDDIDLSTIDANTKSAGNQKFKFIGTSGFHHKAGELHYVKQNLAGSSHDKTIVEGDVNGDGHADFQIELTGLKTLTAGDFVL